MIKNYLLLFVALMGFIHAQGEVTNPRIAHILEKKEKFLNDPQNREKIQQRRARVKELIEKVKSRIEQHKIAEETRIKKQEEFNNRVLYQLEISPENPPFTLVVHNSDIGKGLFVLLDWGVEWCLYQKILNCWANFVSDYIIQHRQEFIAQSQKPDQFIAQLKSKDFIAHMISDFLPSMAAYLCMGQLSDALRHHYLLDRSSAQNIITLLIANLVGLENPGNQGQTSLFDFVASRINLPLTMAKTGILDQANDYLKDFKLFNIKLFPEWTKSTSYLITKKIAFMGLFMHWSVKSFFQPLLAETLVNNREKLIELQKPEEIKKIILDSHKKLFPHWLTLKSERYSVWQTTVNVAIMVPTVAPKIYDFIKWIMMKKDEAANFSTTQSETL